MSRKMLQKQNTMIHTNMPRMCTVFLLPCRLTLSAIMGVKFLTPINGRPCQFAQSKENHAISRQTCVNHCILLLKHLSNHMHFIRNGYKRFLQTNSSDPRQRVPLMYVFLIYKKATLETHQETQFPGRAICDFLFKMAVI